MYYKNEFNDTIQGDICNIDLSCEFIIMIEDKYYKRSKTLLSAKKEVNKLRGKRTCFITQE